MSEQPKEVRRLASLLNSLSLLRIEASTCMARSAKDEIVEFVRDNSDEMQRAFWTIMRQMEWKR